MLRGRSAFAEDIFAGWDGLVWIGKLFEETAMELVGGTGGCQEEYVWSNETLLFPD